MSLVSFLPYSELHQLKHVQRYNDLMKYPIFQAYFFNISPENLKEIVEYYSDAENDRMVEIPYEVAHNLIYGSIEFAEEAGIEPVDAWDITQYILEEDDDNVPLIEYQWGLNGMHYLLAEDRLEVSCYLSTMQEHFAW